MWTTAKQGANNPDELDPLLIEKVREQFNKLRTATAATTRRREVGEWSEKP